MSDANVLQVVTDQPIIRDNDGKHYSLNGAGTDFWLRYMVIFQRIEIITRLKNVDNLPDEAMTIDGDRISVIPLPIYHGPLGYLKVAGSLKRALFKALDPNKSHLLRMPGRIPVLAGRYLTQEQIPYGVEVIADPDELFSTARVGGVLAPLWRLIFTRQTRQVCGHASAAAYVNKTVLPRLYPPKPGAFQTSYSSVQLSSELIREHPRDCSINGVPKLLLAGTMAQRYKGFHVFIKAAALLKRAGIDFTATIAGDGALRPALEQQCRSLGVADRIDFPGRIERRQVLGLMDDHDLFVFPSLSEGLPRAVIEALARGIPAVGTPVGGIPELLEPQSMVPPGDVKALSNLIQTVLGSITLRRHMSARGLTVAAEYTNDRLDQRRKNLYQAVKTAAARRPADE